MSTGSQRAGRLWWIVLGVIGLFFGGAAGWMVLSFGPRDIPAGAPACPLSDWASLNADGVVFGSFSNSDDRRELDRPNGIIAEAGGPYPRCLALGGVNVCNLSGPAKVQVNRPDGPIVVALEDGQSARLRNAADQPFACGLLDETPAAP